MNNFVNYHKHSMYSNVITPDSAVTPLDYCRRVLELGQTVLSGVEHGSSLRYIEYYDLAKANNLKFLFGLEAYIVTDRLSIDETGKKDATNAHIVLLAKNENGRKAINKIISQANIDGFYYKARIDLGLLFSLPKDDVWVTTACLAGIWKLDKYQDIILKCQEHFGNNFFLEVQPHHVKEQAELNKLIINLSNQYNIPIIAGMDSHYIYPNQAKDRDDFLLSRGIKYEDENNWFMDFPSYEEVYRRFIKQGILTTAQIEEALSNTLTFEQVEEYTSPIFSSNVKLPTIYSNKTQEEKDIIFTELIESQWELEKNNVPKDKWKLYEKEIAKEVDTIVETHMADYFLLDYAIVKRGVEMGGHITLTSRGSAPSFYVSKLLGFTTIDRISAEVKLFPERFITKERILDAGTLPDIDLNLGNPEVFYQAQKEILGENNSFPMIAYGTAKPKAAWKIYARSQGLDFPTANAVSDDIEKYEMAIKHAENEEDRQDIDVMDYINKKYANMYKASIKYQGTISDAKVAPCGYLLYSNNIVEEIGLIRLKDNLCTLMDGLWAEAYHFLKNDLLKVSVVELIYQVYEKIGIKPHTLPELIKLSENNDKVWEVYKNAWTVGINQLEQGSTSGRVAKYAPQNISELSAFVAAIRPGFKSYYHRFENREPFNYGVPTLDKQIQTEQFPYSYMLYQENAMAVMRYAGIPISETYEVVKNIAKKRAEKVFKYKDIFMKGMTKRLSKDEDLPKDKAEQISADTWQVIEDSSAYSFNASHSFSVAGDGLYGAYLKSTYPLAFYEVLLNQCEHDGDKERLALAKDEAKRAYKIKFPPYRFGQDNRKIVADKDKWEITSSLQSLKGLGKKVGEDMWALAQQEFTDFMELLIYAEEHSMLYSYFENLIMIQFFEKFGGNKKLYQFHKEFIEGKNRYIRTHKDATKEKRLAGLKEYWNSLPDEHFDLVTQLSMDLEVLGAIQAQYNIPKNYLYITSVDTKYAPRVETYCLATGTVNSLKIRKSVYEDNPFGGNEIIKLDFTKRSDGSLVYFKKEPRRTFQDGVFMDEEGKYDWWTYKYSIVSPDDLLKIVEHFA